MPVVHTINNTNQDVIEYAYTYEADGQIDAIDSSEDGLYEYTYDNQGQLTDVTLDDGGGAEAIEHYQYLCPCQLRVADFFAEGLRWPGAEKRLCWVSRG